MISCFVACFISFAFGVGLGYLLYILSFHYGQLSYDLETLKEDLHNIIVKLEGK